MARQDNTRTHPKLVLDLKKKNQIHLKPVYLNFKLISLE